MKIHLLCFLALTMLLQGCGVTLSAHRVTLDKVPAFVPGEGIVYALPKTEFQVLQTIKLNVPTSGALQDVFEGCKRACDPNPQYSGDACKFNIAPSVNFATPELKTAPIPDPTRLYQISPDAELFQTLAFKFEIASNGVLDKADTAATNTAYEVVGSVLGTAIKVGGLAMTSAKSQVVSKFQAMTSPEAGRTCYQTSVDVDALGKSGELSCTLAKEVDHCLMRFDKVIDDARSELNKLFDSAKSDKTEVKLLEALAVNKRERIDMAIRERNDAAALYGLSEGKPKEATFQLTLPIGSPQEFIDYSNGATLSEEVTQGRARIAGMSENAAALLPMLLDKIGSDTRYYIVTSAVPTNIRLLRTGESEPADGGYRYRVPVPASTTLTVYEDISKDTIKVGPFVEQKLVAQYGPVAALPSRFKGKGGRVMVKHWPEYGGLQTVEIGADALPSSAVTGVLDEAFNQYKVRKDKAEAAAATAAATDTELDTLTRQQKILTLQKQIKDLQDQLKN